MSDLGVAHLSVGKSYVLTARLKLGVRVVFEKIVPVRGGGGENNVALVMFADSPSVENHQQCFLCHIVVYLFLECAGINAGLTVLITVTHLVWL